MPLFLVPNIHNTLTSNAVRSPVEVTNIQQQWSKLCVPTIKGFSPKPTLYTWVCVTGAETLQSTFLLCHLNPCWAQPAEDVRGRQGLKKGLAPSCRLPISLVLSHQRSLILAEAMIHLLSALWCPTLVQPGPSQENKNNTKLMKWKIKYVLENWKSKRGTLR